MFTLPRFRWLILRTFHDPNVCIYPFDPTRFVQGLEGGIRCEFPKPDILHNPLPVRLGIVPDAVC